MNVGTYRESRVKVTSEIKKELVRLMQDEEDTGQKKKHPAKWYRNAVSTNLSLVEGANPSLRAYEVTITKLRDVLEATNPLDEEWHIGTLRDYPLPPEAVAKILEYKVKARSAGSADYISVRNALWMARFSQLPLSVDNLWWLGRRYSTKEQLFDFIGEEYAFSPDSDEFLLKLLSTRSADLMKENFTPVTPNLLADFAKWVSENVTPERQKEMADKKRKHKRESEK